MQVSKVYNIMYHVYCLRKLNVDSKIICLLYNSVLSSVLTYATSSWYGAFSNYLNNDICKFMKVSNMINSTDVKEKMEDPATTYYKLCQSTLCKIVNDQTHHVHRWCYLVTIIITHTHTHTLTHPHTHTPTLIYNNEKVFHTISATLPVCY